MLRIRSEFASTEDDSALAMKRQLSFVADERDENEIEPARFTRLLV